MCHQKLPAEGLLFMQRNYNKIVPELQEKLPKNGASSTVSVFTEKKQRSFYLASIERALKNHAKAERLEVCGTQLVFEKREEAHALIFGNFCRVRLCPMCAWRRSLKLQSQMYQISDFLSDRYGYIFLTLTVRNCEAEQLRETIEAMQYAWQKFKQLKAVKKILKGYYRGIEVTHDCEREITKKRYNRAKGYYQLLGLEAGDTNPNFDKYHPHYHIVLAVPKSYFTSRDYIRREQFREMWTSCMKADYALQVDVKAVRPEKTGKQSMRSAVNEVTKYAIKDTDYLTDDFELDKATVSDLERELANLRFVSMGGVFKEAHAQLNLGDYDDPATDAQHTSDPAKLVAYIWRTGVTRYDEDAPYVKQWLDYEAARHQHKAEVLASKGSG